MSMTIDEAIAHAMEVAGEQQERADSAELIDILDGLDVESCKECAAEHRQLAEWLTDYKELKNSIGAAKFSNMKEALELIREYKAENIAQKKLIAEYKRLLKAAVEDMYNSVNDVHCKYCSKWHTDQCQGTSHLDCYVENKFKWRHADKALALIGEDTNVGHKSGGWISVKDRLPEAVEKDVNGKIAFSDFVLVYLVCDDGFTYITNDKCRVDNKSWLHEIPGEGCKVTHWMPLPDPPKDGDTNG